MCSEDILKIQTLKPRACGSECKQPSPHFDQSAEPLYLRMIAVEYGLLAISRWLIRRRAERFLTEEKHDDVLLLGGPDEPLGGFPWLSRDLGGIGTTSFHVKMGWTDG